MKTLENRWYHYKALYVRGGYFVDLPRYDIISLRLFTRAKYRFR